MEKQIRKLEELAENKRLVEENKRLVEENKRLGGENKRLLDENKKLAKDRFDILRDNYQLSKQMEKTRTYDHQYFSVYRETTMAVKIHELENTVRAQEHLLEYKDQEILSMVVLPYVLG